MWKPSLKAAIEEVTNDTTTKDVLENSQKENEDYEADPKALGRF